MYCKNCGADLSQQDRYPVCIICRKGKGKGNKFCAYCGAELSAPGADRCDACGRPTGPEDPKRPITPEMARFRPIYAAILSLVMPGMGQAMNFQLVKGIVIFIAYVLLNGFTSGPKYALLIQGAYAVLAAFDAYRISDRLHSGESVGKWEWF